MRLENLKQVPTGETCGSEKSERSCPQDAIGIPLGSRRPAFGYREFGELGGPVPVQLFPEVVHNLP